MTTLNQIMPQTEPGTVRCAACYSRESIIEARPVRSANLCEDCYQRGRKTATSAADIYHKMGLSFSSPFSTDLGHAMDTVDKETRAMNILKYGPMP